MPTTSATALLNHAGLARIFVNATGANIDLYLPAIAAQCDAGGINTPIRLAHFLAQIGHESGELRSVEENLNYSAAALSASWPKLFDPATAAAYAHQPQRIANRAYGDRNGNGIEATGDGWKFRGRGLIQLTFHDNYKAYSTVCGVDCVGTPDIVSHDPQRAVGASVWYWNNRGLSPLADQDGHHPEDPDWAIKHITFLVNGGYNGLPDRTRILNLAKSVLLTG